jgi:hypothetical protein
VFFSEHGEYSCLIAKNLLKGFKSCAEVAQYTLEQEASGDGPDGVRRCTDSLVCFTFPIPLLFPMSIEFTQALFPLSEDTRQLCIVQIKVDVKQSRTQGSRGSLLALFLYCLRFTGHMRHPSMRVGFSTSGICISYLRIC